MQILIATPLSSDEVGGPATHVRMIEKSFGALDVSYTIISFKEVRHLPKGISHLVYFYRLFRASKGADLIYAMDGMSVGLPASIAAKLRRKKLVLRIPGIHVWEQAVQRMGVEETLDDFIAHQKKYGLKVRLWMSLSRYILHCAHTIIVPSHYLKHVIESIGIERKVTVIYSAFDRSRFTAVYDPSSRSNDIVTAGRLVPWKGMKTLLRAFAKISTEFPDARLVIIGDGPQKQELLSCAEDLSLHTRVLFTGVLAHEEVLKSLRRGKLFVLNTGYEGLSHLLLEAMDARIPIITTQVGGNPELIEHGKSGMLVEYNDEEGLFAAMKQLLHSPDEAKRLTETAQEKLELFATDHIVRQLYNELTRVCTSSQ